MLEQLIAFAIARWIFLVFAAFSRVVNRSIKNPRPSSLTLLQA
jgi:hypothetical protein